MVQWVEVAGGRAAPLSSNSAPHGALPIWLLLVSNNQDGDGPNAQLDASKQQFTNQLLTSPWITTWQQHTIYYTYLYTVLLHTIYPWVIIYIIKRFLTIVTSEPDKVNLSLRFVSSLSYDRPWSLQGEKERYLKNSGSTVYASMFSRRTKRISECVPSVGTLLVSYLVYWLLWGSFLYALGPYTLS